MDGFGDSNNVDTWSGAAFKNYLFLGTRNDTGWQSPATGAEVWKLQTPSYIPVLLTPVDGASPLFNRPVFDWQDVPGATSYTIQIGRDPGFGTLVGAYTVTTSTYTPTSDLPADSTLYWRVKINKTGVANPWSDPFSLRTANPPSVPVLVTPPNNALTTNYKPLLDWNNSVLPPVSLSSEHYQVQVAANSGFTSPVIDKTIVGLTNSQYTPTTALAPNTTWYWHVRAYNSLGQYSAWSTLRTFRTAIAPPVLLLPHNLSSTSNHKPLFDWNSMAGAGSYTFQVSRSNTFSTLLVNLAVTPSTYTPTTNLPSGVLYWRVRANGTNGPSLWSTVWRLTITP